MWFMISNISLMDFSLQAILDSKSPTTSGMGTLPAAWRGGDGLRGDGLRGDGSRGGAFRLIPSFSRKYSSPSCVNL